MNDFEGSPDKSSPFEKLIGRYLLKERGLLGRAVTKALKFDISLENLKKTVEEDPRFVLSIVCRYKDKPYAEEIIKIAAEEDPCAALEFANQYKDLPCAGEVIEKAAKRFPWRALEYADRYKDKPFAEGVIEKAAEKFPWNALEFADKYIYQPYAEKVIRKSAEEFPGSALEFADKYRGQPYAEDVLKKAAERAPVAVIVYAYKHKEKIFSTENLLKIAEKYPRETLSQIYSYKSRPYAKTVFKLAALKEPEYAFQLVKEYKEQPYAAEIIETLGDLDPTLALQYSDKYKDQPYAERVIKKAAERRSASVFHFADKYKEQPYAEQILGKAAETYPVYAFCEADKYIDQPYAKHILEIAIEYEPALAFQDFYVIENKPYTKELLRKALRYYPDPFKELSRATDPFVIYSAFDSMEEFLEFSKSNLEVEKYRHLYEELVTQEKITELNESRIMIALMGARISIPRDAFVKVFFMKSFQAFLQKLEGEFYFANAFSMVNAVYRKLKSENKEMTDKNINDVLTVIWGKIDEAKNVEILGPNTKLILFSHEESSSFNDEFLGYIYKKCGGTRGNFVYSGNGVKMGDGKNLVKKNVLSAIEKSEGNTTIVFNGHGSATSWAFSGNTPEDLKVSLKKEETTLNYDELGDALIKSGNIKNISILVESCFAYDYIENLYKYLEEKGVYEKPRFAITAANKGRYSYNWGATIVNSIFFGAIYKQMEEGKPLRFIDVLKAEGQIWYAEDPSFRIGDELIGGLEKSTYEEVAKTNVPKGKKRVGYG